MAGRGAKKWGARVGGSGEEIFQFSFLVFQFPLKGVPARVV